MDSLDLGLPNFGNNCFLNATLQILFSSRVHRGFLLSIPHPGDLGEDSTIVEALRVLCGILYLGETGNKRQVHQLVVNFAYRLIAKPHENSPRLTNEKGNNNQSSADLVLQRFWDIQSVKDLLGSMSVDVFRLRHEQHGGVERTLVDKALDLPFVDVDLPHVSLGVEVAALAFDFMHTRQILDPLSLKNVVVFHVRQPAEIVNVDPDTVANPFTRDRINVSSEHLQVLERFLVPGLDDDTASLYLLTGVVINLADPGQEACHYYAYVRPTFSHERPNTYQVQPNVWMASKWILVNDNRTKVAKSKLDLREVLPGMSLLLYERMPESTSLSDTPIPRSRERARTLDATHSSKIRREPRPEPATAPVPIPVAKTPKAVKAAKAAKAPKVRAPPREVVTLDSDSDFGSESESVSGSESSEFESDFESDTEEVSRTREGGSKRVQEMSDAKIERLRIQDIRGLTDAEVYYLCNSRLALSMVKFKNARDELERRLRRAMGA